MGSFSIWHWAIVILIVVLLFGRGKISDLMGDVAKGIKSFKRGLAEEDKDDEPKAIPSEMADRSKDSVKDKVAG
jgi:sec-independent protein translocase protein TatA